MLSQIVANTLVVGASYALFAVSFGLVYRTARFLHVAHGAVYTAAAYGLFLAKVTMELPEAIAIIMAISVAVALGVCTELYVYRPLQRRQSGSNVLLLASLGIMIAVQNVISAVFGNGTQTVIGSEIHVGWQILNARLTTVQCASAVIGAVAAIFLSWLLQHTKWGTTVRAVASDTDLSSIAGLKVPRIRLTVFALASACAAVAAILDAYNTDVTPEMGFRLMLMGITACIIGGIGSIRGAYLGSFLIALVQQVTAWCWSAQWQDVGIFIVLILTLLIRPQGFFGVPLRRAHA